MIVDVFPARREWRERAVNWHTRIGLWTDDTMMTTFDESQTHIVMLGVLSTLEVDGTKLAFSLWNVGSAAGGMTSLRLDEPVAGILPTTSVIGTASTMFGASGC